MDKFQEKELKGRSWFSEMLTQFGATDLQPTTDAYDKVDIYFTHKGKNIVAEIKCRDIKYLDYPEHIIEEIKIKGMFQAKNEKNCDEAYYVNFFGENVAIVYTLKAILKHSRKDTLWCNRTTAELSNKIEKVVCYIPVECGRKYVKVDGKWSSA